MKSFESISKYYDKLTFIMFCGRVQRANMEYTSDLKHCNRLLIVGGGSGIVLTKVPSDVKVDFIDPSHSMIDKAKKRKSKGEVTFHLMRFEEFKAKGKYDMVICPFYLDLYPSVEFKDVVQKIEHLLTEDGTLWVSDLRKSAGKRIIPRILFWGMKIFFRQTLGIETDELIDVDSSLQKKGWQATKYRTYFFGMIFSGLFRKS